MSKVINYVLPLICILLSTVNALGQNDVIFDKTNVRFEAPEHFELSDQFTGYIHKITGTTINFNVMENTSKLAVKLGFEQADLHSQGVALKSIEDLFLNDGKQAHLVTMTMVVDDIEFTRLVLIFGDYNDAVRVEANYPSMFDEDVHPVLLNSFKTAKYK